MHDSGKMSLNSLVFMNLRLCRHIILIEYSGVLPIARFLAKSAGNVPDSFMKPSRIARLKIFDDALKPAVKIRYPLEVKQAIDSNLGLAELVDDPIVSDLGVGASKTPQPMPLDIDETFLGSFPRNETRPFRSTTHSPH